MTMDARVSGPTGMQVLIRSRFFLALVEALALFAWPTQMCVPRRFIGAIPRVAT